MIVYTNTYIKLCQDLMATKGADIRRWANDSNPAIADIFKECIEIGERREQK